MRHDKQKGFSLIELMIVIAVLAILVSIAMPRYAIHMKKANAASCLSNRRLMETEEVARIARHSPEMPGKRYTLHGIPDPVETSLLSTVATMINAIFPWNISTAHAVVESTVPPINSGYTCASGGVYLWLVTDPTDKHYPKVGCSIHFGQTPQDVIVGKTGLDMIDGLVGSFKMDEGSGSVVNFGDFTADIHDAKWVEGKSGSALYFDGKKDYAKADIEDWSGPFTVMAWVKADPVKQHQYDSVFSSGMRPHKNNFQIDSDGKGNYRFLGGSSRIEIGEITDDWQLVSVSFDGANVTTYNNGELTSTGKWNGAGEFTHYKVGINRNTNRSFTGAIDELGVFNRAVTAEEIAAYYEMTK